MIEEQTASVVNLNALPRSINDANQRLLLAIEIIYVLEDFLLGSQVRDCAPKAKKEKVSIVQRCFDNLAEISNSIEECHNRLGNITEKLGIPDIKEPEIREVSDV